MVLQQDFEERRAAVPEITTIRSFKYEPFFLVQGRIQELGAGGAQVRVWQGVGQSWMRSRPGEGAGGGHPSRPARGSGGAL